LSYLHDRKKIHRDIKPSNLLINSLGFVKIADFGVSRSLDCSSDLADTFIGTLGYMSPERITGRSLTDETWHCEAAQEFLCQLRPPSSGQEYSFEADIWGLGLSIVACAVGNFPLNTISGGGGYWGLVHAGGCSEDAVSRWPGLMPCSPAVCDTPAPALPPDSSEKFRDFIQR
jgi:serine/threonine protein kinase